MPVVTTSSKKQIVLAAERLFAAHGTDGISLRQIGVAAGNGNNSAVQYHFGSKELLIRAIFEYRLPRLYQRRLALLAECDQTSLRGVLECQVRALMEHSDEAGSHYLCFVATLNRHGRGDILGGLPAPLDAMALEFRQRLGALLPHLAEPLRSHRVAQVMTIIVDTTAERQRRRASDLPVLPFDVQAMDLLDGAVGFLMAPISPQTLEAVERTRPAPILWPALL